MVHVSSDMPEGVSLLLAHKVSILNIKIASLSTVFPTGFTWIFRVGEAKSQLIEALHAAFIVVEQVTEF